MKRKKNLVIMVAIMLVILAGCSVKEKDKVIETVQMGTEIMGGKFDIEYACWYNAESKNIFSTYDNYIQKDLISAGKIKEEWKISDVDLNRLEELIREYEVFNVNKKVNALEYSLEDKNYVITPMQEFYVKFTIDGKEYLIEGNWTIYDIVQECEEAKKICEFLDGLRGIMLSQDVYENMPETEGAYE